MKEAVNFAQHNQAMLSTRAVWLFSSGPLGSADPQPKGEPAHLDQLVGRTGARSHRTFAGNLDNDELGLGERLIVRAIGALEGDFRDWSAIKVWADEIAEGLLTMRARAN